VPEASRRTTSFSADDDDDEGGFFQQHPILGTVGVILLIAGAILAFRSLSGPSTPMRKAPPQTVVNIQLPPPAPPPPPPPPPPRQPPPEQKEERMIEQAPVEEAEQKPDDKPPDEPPADPIGTNVTGTGPPDGFGLGRGGNGMIGGTGGGGRGRGGSRWGWYAGQIQTKIADGLRSNRKTRTARLNGVQVRVWADSTGRVTRAQLAGSSGDPAIDSVIQNEVLTGLQLPEPPPAGMPMPIVLRLSARRPN
jgi:outer membrane biosynthesis protein TonB